MIAETEFDHIKAPSLWICFLAVDGKWIKIGKSRKPRGVRLAQHCAPSLDGHIPNVKLLCEVRASGDIDERTVHKYFAHLRGGSGNETFKATPELVDYIRWLRDEHYVSVEEDSDDTRESMPLVSSEAWLPRPERTKPRDNRLLPGLYQPFDLGPRVVTCDDFYTSNVLIEAARSAMGSIDLDPASHAMANRVVRAANFFTASTNGLAQEWSGNVWCNPPFSAWAQWARKMLAELESGRVKQLCALAATRTMTAKYFIPLLDACDALCLTRGRIPFWGGLATGSPDDGHGILYFGNKPEDFLREFSSVCVPFLNPKKVPA